MTAPETIYLDGDVSDDEGYFPRCFNNSKYADEPANVYHHESTCIRRDDPVLKQVMEALKYWQHQGCPNCSGDCASANPPVGFCPMVATDAAYTALKERIGEKE